MTYRVDGALPVSVIVPAYNAQEHIAAAIRSVLRQTFSDLEVIVVDDCSTDATSDIVRAVAANDARVRLVRLSKNRGAPAGPRNEGVRAARGEWIAFLDADDIWHPRKLACQLQAVTRTGASFCSTQMLDFRDERDLNLPDPEGLVLERIGFLKQLVKFRTPTSSVLVKKELLIRHPFNEAMSYKAREDLDCWLHCHEESGWSIKIAHPLVGYRVSPSQISRRKWTMVLRHYHVLRRYRFRSGAKLGIGAFIFTFSHFGSALFQRSLTRRL